MFYEKNQDLSGSDWSIYSEDGNLPEGCRGIVNPNYPGFQHLGPSLLSDTDDTEDEEPEISEDEFNNNKNNDETVNRLDNNHLDKEKQLFYDKPKFNLQMNTNDDSIEDLSSGKLFCLEKNIKDPMTVTKRRVRIFKKKTILFFIKNTLLF